jgi:Ca2+/Na+ antiporter
LILATAAVIAGLILLVWSADRFVLGASATAQHLGMPPLLIGMVIVGFGTSAPEMVVSALAAAQGNPGLALGNAFGSNVANVGLILATTALISPIAAVPHGQSCGPVRAYGRLAPSFPGRRIQGGLRTTATKPPKRLLSFSAT